MTKLYDPISLVPPHRITCPEHVDALQEDMMARGWVGSALVGYWSGEAIQLLSGTHRRLAAIRAGIQVPVKVFDYARVYKAYGIVNEWEDMMKGLGD